MAEQNQSQKPEQNKPDDDKELDNIGFLKKLFKYPWEFLNGDDDAEENKTPSKEVIETTGEEVK